MCLLRRGGGQRRQQEIRHVSQQDHCCNGRPLLPYTQTPCPCNSYKHKGHKPTAAHPPTPKGCCINMGVDHCGSHPLVGHKSNHSTCCTHWPGHPYGLGCPHLQQTARHAPCNSGGTGDLSLLPSKAAGLLPTWTVTSSVWCCCC